MNAFKHLIFRNGVYHIKQYPGAALLFGILYFLVSLALVFLSAYIKTGLVLTGPGILVIILSKTSHRSSFKIDPANRTLGIQHVRFAKEQHYPLNHFQHFTMEKITYARISIHFTLIAHFCTNGKPKKVVFSQAGSARPLQELMNELTGLFGQPEFKN